MANDSTFTHTQLEGIAHIIGQFDYVLSHSVLEQKVAEIGIVNWLDSSKSKKNYLIDAFESWQRTTGSSTNVLKLIGLVAEQVLYTGTPEQSTQLTDGLNRILKKYGYVLSDDGVVNALEPGQPASTLKHPVDSLPEQSDIPFPGTYIPPALRESVAKFQGKYPHRDRTGFIIMRFGKEKPLLDIATTIKDTVSGYGLNAVRADDMRYHRHILPNVETYMWGCGFGIAVFDRYESDKNNANVALEVGYMLALGKPVCLLKDRNVENLQADLLGMIYDEFDPLEVLPSVREALVKWLRDNELVS